MKNQTLQPGTSTFLSKFLAPPGVKSVPVNQPKDSNHRKESSSVKFFNKINVVGRITGVAGGKGLNLCGFDSIMVSLRNRMAESRGRQSACV